MFTELYDYFANWKFIIVFIAVNIILLVYNLNIVLNCLNSQATGITKSVLITGCDSGFGYKTSLELNASKVKVFSGCLTKEGVRRLQDDPAFRGHAFIMDVTNQDDINKTYTLIKEEVKDKGLWCVVNNAGIIQPGLIEWQTTEEMQKIMNVNLWGTVNVTKTMLPLVKRAGGRIVNVVSMAGRVTLPLCSAYSMSKYACEAFSDCLRYEMKCWDVSVHIIEPGIFNTNLVKTQPQQWKTLWNSLPSTTKEEYGSDYFENILVKEKEIVSKFGSSNIKKVTDAICHAVLSSNPKLRYVVGYDAMLYVIASMLPTFISDWIGYFLTKPHATPAVMKKKNEKILPDVFRNQETAAE
ncbi:17-beta-hydroxysteroid dehydrogenase type 6-like [Hydractinia symbiolongicarpus]|uniref:17-beta-hydroxysteroid dehydrogenase type 6-like n=1 Tax=Hydractinia symbiolongicarpus TaxID=13093 RepID=UPI002550045F|nr:17-beta-hydroxysteroid dehydrogenase type 6-like [Hydractinia symbiolongicarpus]